MLRQILSSLVLTSISLSAAAATPFSWQGPYLGAYLGGAFANDHMTNNVGNVTSTSYFATVADVNAVNSVGTGVNTPNSMIVGVQAGHDWAWKRYVYGVAFDYTTLPLSSSNGVTNTLFPDSTDRYSVTTTMRTNWLFTLRGRLGYDAMFRWPTLFYITGGFAVTQLNVKNSYSDNSALLGLGGTSIYNNQIGWIAGLGFEIASIHHCSINFEYDYLHVPSVKASSTISNNVGGFGISPLSLTSPFSTTGNFHANIFKLGINYRFDE